MHGNNESGLTIVEVVFVSAMVLVISLVIQNTIKTTKQLSLSIAEESKASYAIELATATIIAGTRESLPTSATSTMSTCNALSSIGKIYQNWGGSNGIYIPEFNLSMKLIHKNDSLSDSMLASWNNAGRPDERIYSLINQCRQWAGGDYPLGTGPFDTSPQSIDQEVSFCFWAKPSTKTKHLQKDGLLSHGPALIVGRYSLTDAYAAQPVKCIDFLNSNLIETPLAKLALEVFWKKPVLGKESGTPRTVWQNRVVTVNVNPRK